MWRRKKESVLESKEKSSPNGAQSKDEKVTLVAIKNAFGDIDDAVFKDYQTANGLVTIIYLNTLIDSTVLHKTVISPIMNNSDQLIQVLDHVISTDLRTMLMEISDGNTLIYLHEEQRFFKASTFSPPQRSIMTSEIESTVLGPQDSFTESLKTNLSLIKRRIHQPGLKSKDRVIGNETNTKISIMYMEHIVNKENLQRLEQRIKEVDEANLLFIDITILTQLIEDNPFSPFPHMGMTARPDLAAHFLLDGRIVVAMENSQNMLVCPVSFLEMFKSPEDYYSRWTTATLLRLIRLVGFFITIMLTPTYISAVTYHPGIIPFDLVLILEESRSKVPFPPVIEVLLIELIIEVLREAGARLPTKIGQTIGIVGGIVIGTAAVEAGLLSNTLIVLVATSALLSFLLPSFLMSNSSRVIRYIFILAAGLFGLLGQMLALAWLVIHLLNLTSLGTPYLAPFIPRKLSDLYDTVIRFPLKFIQKRKGISRPQQENLETK
ncbi:spore germination protein [Paenisporosarcina sp. TG20]|uniref:spore germination protein n=1 Tax=Paenisporosarcina sp. TG20 TaxID=1211706 RepID=UPI0002F5F720|nr:spore germination protein [Paenisporosarcina sp. TG20]